MIKKRALQTLDAKQLKQVTGGIGTQPQPWIVSKPVTPPRLDPEPLPW